MILRNYLSELDCSNRPHKYEEVWIKSSNGYYITTMKRLKSVANCAYDACDGFTFDLNRFLESELENYEFDFSRLCTEGIIKIKVNLK